MTIKNPILLALAATAVLALGACGASDDDNTGSAQAGEDKAFEGALKFAKCMRDEGLDVPDPQRGPDGGILQKMGGTKGGRPEQIDRAAMERAQKKCEHFMDVGGGDAPDPAEQARRQDAFVAYSRCMRAHGIDMPDPKFEGNKVTMSIHKGGAGATGPVPDSPVFKKADTACHPKLAEVEKGLPGGGRP